MEFCTRYPTVDSILDTMRAHNAADQAADLIPACPHFAAYKTQPWYTPMPAFLDVARKRGIGEYDDRLKYALALSAFAQASAEPYFSRVVHKTADPGAVDESMRSIVFSINLYIESNARELADLTGVEPPCTPEDLWEIFDAALGDAFREHNLAIAAWLGAFAKNADAVKSSVDVQRFMTNLAASSKMVGHDRDKNEVCFLPNMKHSMPLYDFVRAFASGAGVELPSAL